MKATLEIWRNGKYLGISWQIGTASNPKHVTTHAMIQVLMQYFSIPFEEMKGRVACGKPTRAWKPFAKRTRREQTGAFMAAYWWLLASEDGAFFLKAAPFSVPIYNSMGQEAWQYCAEQVGLSATQVAQLLTTLPPETATPNVKPHDPEQPLLDLFNSQPEKS